MLKVNLAESTLQDLSYILEGDLSDYTPDEILQMIPEYALQALAEGAKRTIVVRGGKKKIKFVCGKGMKLVTKGAARRCMKMSGKEKAQKSRIAKRSARKAKAKRSRANAKRARSMRKRQGIVRR
jgi:hypothetical protein